MPRPPYEHLEARDFAEPPEIPGISEIPGGYATYSRRIAQAQTEAHNGEKAGAYTAEQETAFALAIGQAADIEAHIATLPEHQREAARQEQAESLLAGRQARDALVTGNLRFAAYYARASMNILPGKKSRRATKKAAAEQAPADAPLEPENIDAIDVDEDMSTVPRRIGAYADITRLRSGRAELDDRVQVATEALIMAAGTYRHKLDSNKKRVTFASHAGYKMHAALGDYAKVAERPGWDTTPYKVEKSLATLQEPEAYYEEEREEARRLLAGQDAVPLDELAVDAGLPAEEYESDWRAVTPLELADVYPDPWPEVKTRALGGLIIGKAVELSLTKTDARGAGVLRLLYGINDEGKKYTLKEVGEVYGISIESVRQIKQRTISKLWADKQLKAVRDAVEQPMTVPLLRHDIVVTPFHESIPTMRTTSVAEGASLASAPALDTQQAEQVVDQEREELYARPLADDWNQPSRLPAEHLAGNYERVRADLKRLLYRSGDYHFQKSFAEDMGSEYPRGIASIINEQIGKQLTVGHLEEFWNTSIETYTDIMQHRLGEDFDINRVSSLFSRLLAERMHDEDTVELTIPEKLDGTFEYMGAWLRNGKIVIRGNVGDFAGYKINDLAQIEVHGDVGDFAAIAASGHAMMHVTGNAGHFFGGQASKYVHLRVDGSVGDNCGYEFTGPDSLMVIAGSAGKNPGELSRGSVITIDGKELPAAA